MRCTAPTTSLAWVVVRLFGYGELALRLPSAIAMAVAAVFVAALGRRLVSPGAGLAAGLLFAVIPDISLYGQDARSYAMVDADGHDRQLPAGPRARRRACPPAPLVDQVRRQHRPARAS